MGIGLGYYNRDGRADLYVTAFSDCYNALYHNDDGGYLSKVTW